ncbi:MAG: hypothetical protein R3Y13_04530 [bacterium]
MVSREELVKKIDLYYDKYNILKTLEYRKNMYEIFFNISGFMYFSVLYTIFDYVNKNSENKDEVFNLLNIYGLSPNFISLISMGFIYYYSAEKIDISDKGIKEIIDQRIDMFNEAELLNYYVSKILTINEISEVQSIMNKLYELGYLDELSFTSLYSLIEELDNNKGFIRKKY